MDETRPYKKGFEAMYKRMHERNLCDLCGTQVINNCCICGAPVCCPKCCNQDSIVHRLTHPSTEDMTILLRDAAIAIMELQHVAAQHRDGRLDALEKLAKHQGPALDVDVWNGPNACGEPGHD